MFSLWPILNLFCLQAAVDTLRVAAATRAAAVEVAAVAAAVEVRTF
jgi:hypothetical protein